MSERSNILRALEYQRLVLFILVLEESVLTYDGLLIIATGYIHLPV